MMSYAQKVVSILILSTLSYFLHYLLFQSYQQHTTRTTVLLFSYQAIQSVNLRLSSYSIS